MKHQIPFIKIPPMIPIEKLSDNAWVIVGVQGPHKDMRFACDRRLVMGRSVSNCNIVFPENTKGISRNHCEVLPTDKGVLIRDLGSTYGTFLENGKCVKKDPVLLKRGDAFFLANTDVMFRIN